MASRFDINVQVVPAARYDGMGFYSFGQTRSLGVKGINKLVNMFAKRLLTPTGTDPLDLPGGTQVPNLIGSNVSLDDAQEVFQVSVASVVEAIQTLQGGRGDVPSDERLASAEVTSFFLVDDGPGFAAQVHVKNVANQGMTVILPSLEVGA